MSTGEDTTEDDKLYMQNWEVMVEIIIHLFQFHQEVQMN